MVIYMGFSALNFLSQMMKMSLTSFLEHGGYASQETFISHMKQSHVKMSFLSFQSVQSLSRVQLFETLWTAARQVPCPTPTPKTCSNSCQSGQWCHPTISSSVSPFSSCLQSFQASGSFPVSQFFSSGGQNTGVSSSAPVLPEYSGMISFNIYWLDLLAVQGTLKNFLHTTIQKHPFFSSQLSL